MTWAAIAFAAGAAALQLQAELPPLLGLLALPPLAWLAYRRRILVYPLAFAAGFGWAALMAQARMADWLAPELEGVDLDVVGVVSGLPALTERSVRFELEVASAGQ